MAKYRVGLVGCRRGAGILKSLATHPMAEISAVCDIDEARLQTMAEAYNIPDALQFSDFDRFIEAPIDIVVIATPIEHHAYQAITAMESGKHVLCEQTAAYTVEDCLKLIDVVKRTGMKYMMAENYCYFHYILEWKKIIDAGRLGNIHYAEGEYIHEIENLLIDPDTGNKRWRFPRAPIWYCAHCLGPVLTLMDDRIVQVTGSSAGRNMHPDKDALGFLDMEVGLFKTEKGSVVKILRSQVAKRYGKNNSHMVWYSLYGTKGFIEAGRTGGGRTDGLLYIDGEMTKEEGAQPYECSTVDPNAPEEAKAGGHGTSEYFMVREFIASIENDTRPPIDVVRSVDFTIPGILAHEAAMKEGLWIDVPEYGW